MAGILVGQTICNCGRVARVKRSSVGNNIPYLHCKKCMQVKSKDEAQRQKWLDEAKESLGVFGELPQSDNANPLESTSDVQTSENEQVEKSDIESHVDTHEEWAPSDKKIAPESTENKDIVEIKPEESEEGSNVVMIGVVGTLLTIGGYLFFKNSSNRGKAA